MTEPTHPQPVDDAHILDRGYRTYEGERGGSIAAAVTIAVAGMRAVLGLGRRARSKAIPVVCVVIAFLPAVIFVGLAALLPSEFLDVAEIADYSGYYGVIVLALVLFTAFVAPEALTGDRRSGMLTLYLTTPTSRLGYVLAKTAAVFIILSIVTIGPLLLNLIGYSLESLGPGGILDTVELLGRMLLAGLLVSAVYTSLSIGVSSLTDRRAWASTGIVVVMILSSVVPTILVETADMSEKLQLLNLLVAPLELVVRIYGDQPEFPELATSSLALACSAWIVAGMAVAIVRYHRIGGAR
ncbi:MAG: ABC transporter permease [Actinomycetia bacterium]|nr:ABC transporter permease [Actinomycetes bacterium]MCP4958237.1 ABC transporter permease [Actinomycetes bacterium]